MHSRRYLVLGKLNVKAGLETCCVRRTNIVVIEIKRYK